MTIQVYQAEQIAGIADMVAKGSVTFASAIRASNKTLDKDVLNKFQLLAAKAGANPDQYDLYYKHSVLASIGWNKNDDVFDKVPTWNARHTVADKQLNLGHNELNIVGHMTDSYVLDAEGNIIPDDTPITNVPDQFDVVSEFVLYKIWADEDRLDEIKKVIADIEAGNGYVSMECRFPAFDYAIIDKDGNHKTVARTQETAFLSQHLKAFGGTGEYQGYKVGRLLRDFFFTGQGIVSNPANERSIIFDTGSKPFTSKGSIIIRDTQMEEQVKSLQAELAAAKAKLTEIDNAKAAEITKAAEAAQKSAAELATAKTALEGELATVKATVTSKDTAIAALTEELKAAKEQVTVITAEVAAMKAEAVKVARAAKLATVVDADKVEATLAKFAGLSDEQFNDIVAMFPPKKAKADDDDDDDDDADAKAKKAKAKEMEDAKCAADKAAKAKVEADLSKTELEAKASLNGGAGGEPDRSKILGDFLSTGLQFSSAAVARREKASK